MPSDAFTGKTLTAPLDRVKLLLQTRGGLQAGALKDAARGGGVISALTAIGKEEGFFGYWKGNVPQVHLLTCTPACNRDSLAHHVFAHVLYHHQQVCNLWACSARYALMQRLLGCAPCQHA